MARTNIENILIYGGGFLIIYYVLKSWGIISPTAVSTSKLTNPNYNINNWKPLTQEQLNNLEVRIQEVNPYISDVIDFRTGRGRLREYGFAGK